MENLKPIKIILTACGCPGASTLIQMLKNNGEREIEIIGVDMDDQAVGRFLVDEFYQVPPAKSKEYIPSMLGLVEKEKPDLVFPESTFEVYPLARNREKFEALGTKVLVSDPEPIKIANNKYQMYEKLSKETDIVLPEYRYPKDLDEFIDYVHQLGFPEEPVCFKPHVGKGSRGFRIIDNEVDRRKQLMEYKPNSRYMSLDEFVKIFEDEELPRFMVMEFIDGMEYTTDPISLDGEMLFCTTKTVEEARWGVIVKGELVEKPDLVEQTRKILSSIDLSYCTNIQFIDDKLIEINPRVSTFIYQENLIAPYLSLKLALNELNPEEVKGYESNINYGRRMVRYMDQVFWNPN